jgi:hypothetical protein
VEALVDAAGAKADADATSRVAMISCIVIICLKVSL